jgi:hypothetical protein
LPSAEVVADPCSLTGGFAAHYRHLLGKPVIANPTFKLSRRLGGADADLIIDGCLLDAKTTTALRMRREDGYQLLGYVLADTDGSYPVNQVGFYLSRVPALVNWDLTGLLNEVAGRPVTVPELRAGFEASVLALGRTGTDPDQGR